MTVSIPPIIQAVTSVVSEHIAPLQLAPATSENLETLEQWRADDQNYWKRSLYKFRSKSAWGVLVLRSPDQLWGGIAFCSRKSRLIIKLMEMSPSLSHSEKLEAFSVFMRYIEAVAVLLGYQKLQVQHVPNELVSLFEQCGYIGDVTVSKTYYSYYKRMS